MPSLSFSAPTSIDEAVKMLAGATGMAKVLAGGTDLLVQLRSGRTRPALHSGGASARIQERACPI
jgi:carbon-monoxide dehydrogenase medium subunit